MFCSMLCTKHDDCQAFYYDHESLACKEAHASDLIEASPNSVSKISPWIVSNMQIKAATTTTKCNSPSDYTYNNVTEKYYKIVKNQQFWEDASDDCTTEGATLIEHRNEAEHQVLKEMFSK